MKIKTVIFSCFLGLTALVNLQNSNGAAAVQEADRTGSPLSSANCSACHGGGNFNPVLTATLLDGEIPATSYTPGKTYTLRIDMAANNNPAAYGFQAVALRESDNSNAGSFSDAPTGFRVINLNNRQYAEHSSRRNSPGFDIKWTAPAAGSGTVNFFAAGIASNANSGISGDNAAALENPLSIEEAISTATRDHHTTPIFDLFPNPASGEKIFLRMERPAQDMVLSIFSIDGKRLYSTRKALLQADEKVGIPIAGLAPGLYQLTLRSVKVQGSRLFVIH